MALNDTAIILFTFENSVQIHCIHTNFIISFSKFLKSILISYPKGIRTN